MRRLPLIRGRACFKRYARGAQHGPIHVLIVKRLSYHWQLLSLRGWGVTIIRVFLNGRVVWTLPDYTWAGDAKMMKKKRQRDPNDNAQHLAAMESNLFSKHQSLVAHAAVTKYDDGDSRQPGWFTIKTMGSAWVVEVKDPDTAMRLVIVQQTLDEAITLAALLLESEEAPWEPDPWLSQQKARKKK